MIKIVFITLGTESAGEMTIALEFARRLPTDRFEITFLAPGKFVFFFQDKRFNHYSLDPKKGKVKNREEILNFFKTQKPRLVIVSDPYTMEYAFSWSGFRFKHLKELGIPVVGIDEFEYPSTDYRIDYFGGLVKQLPPFIEECDVILRNCPLNMPRMTSKKIKNYSFLGEKKKLSRKTKKTAREKLGIGEKEKMIFFATSQWENMCMNKITPLFAFLKWRPIIFENYLNRLKGKVTLVHVGPNPFGVNKTNTSRFKCINLKNVAPLDFEKYLLASDLFITFNIVSVTLSKAVFGEVPSLVLQNDKLINFRKLEKRLAQMPDWYQKMAGEVKKAFPFKTSSFGWNNFLKPVLKDNDYLHTFQRVSFFKMNEVVNSIETLLFDNNAITTIKEKQRLYVENMLRLPTPGKVIEEIINENQ
jgi:hypothetical protein